MSGSTNGAPKLARGTLVAGCFAVALAQIGLAIPATLNGLFQSDPALSPNAAQLTWISTAFNLPVTILELNFGVLGDLFGRKRLMVIGSIVMAVGAILAGTAPGIGMLFVGQALSGIGAGMLFPSSLSLIAAGTHTARDRARTISLWAGFLSLGGFAAPLIGGITGTYGSWRWAFAVVAVIAVLSLIVTATSAVESKSPEGRSLDVPGQLTILIALFGIIYAVVQGPEDGWASPEVIIGFIVGAIFLGVFIRVESRAEKPMLQVRIFKNRAFTIAAIVAVAGMFTFLGTAYATSIRIGAIQHQAPLWTAYAFLLLNGINLFFARFIGRLLDRLDAKWVLAIGLVLMAIGDFWAMLVPITNSSPWAMTPPLILVGVGFLFTVASITVTAVNTVTPKLTGMASATTSMLRDFGMTLGPALVGAIALSQAGSAALGKITSSSLPAASQHAALDVLGKGGPLALGSVPPDSPAAAAHDLILDSLGHGYALGYLACGIASLLAAILTVVGLSGRKAKEQEVEGLEADVSHG